LQTGKTRKNERKNAGKRQNKGEEGGKENKAKRNTFGPAAFLWLTDWLVLDLHRK